MEVRRPVYSMHMLADLNCRSLRTNATIAPAKHSIYFLPKLTITRTIPFKQERTVLTPHTAVRDCSLQQKISPPSFHSLHHEASSNSRREPPPLIYPRYAHAFAGAGAGLAAVLLLHPLDTIRTRLQVSTGGATLRAVRDMAVREGSIALYKGVVPAAFGSVVSWACYFHWFQQAHVFYRKRVRYDPVSHLLAGSTAGAMTSFATNPIWVVKVRLQLQAIHSVDRARLRPYSGFSDGLKSILREEGIRGLYRGLGPSLWLVSHGALQFTLYEQFKTWLKSQDDIGNRRNPAATTTVYQSLVASTASKLIASVSTYPLQVARTRMQDRASDSERYRSFGRAFLHILRTEGIRGLYRGLSANVARVTPQAAVTFITYEQILGLSASQSKGC
ncbi:Mitochondrial carrier [Gracilaria domingensis]|nr:Mitochondrial carrier [Gracilaria domingensis]